MNCATLARARYILLKKDDHLNLCPNWDTLGYKGHVINNYTGTIGTINCPGKISMYGMVTLGLSLSSEVPAKAQI